MATINAAIRLTYRQRNMTQDVTTGEIANTAQDDASAIWRTSRNMTKYNGPIAGDT